MESLRHTDNGKLLSPVVDPAAWYQQDMLDDRSWVYTLDSEQREEIETALIALKSTGLHHRDVKADDFPVTKFSKLIYSLQDQIENGRGVAVLKGIPVENKCIEDLELMYAGLAAHLGHSIVQDTAGTVIDHVCDRGGSYTDISVRGYTTNAELTPHCDSGDIVALLCIRPAMEGGINSIASSISIYNQILKEFPELIETLYQGVHYNIRGNGPPGKYQNITAHRVPIYSYHEGKLSCRFNQKAILTAEQLPGVPALTDLEKRAVNTVAEISLRPELRCDVMLESGDLLLLCNHTVFHTRAAFVDWPEAEKKRLLLRKWINIPNGRPLTWEFADHYNTGSRQGPYVKGEPGQVVTVV